MQKKRQGPLQAWRGGVSLPPPTGPWPLSSSGKETSTPGHIQYLDRETRGAPASGGDSCHLARARAPCCAFDPCPFHICAQAEGWGRGQWQTQASPHQCNLTAAAGGGWRGLGAGRVRRRWLRTRPGKQLEAGRCVSPGSKSPELGPVGLT